MKHRTLTRNTFIAAILAVVLLGGVLLPLDRASAGPPTPTGGLRELRAEAPAETALADEDAEIQTLGTVTLNAVADTTLDQAQPNTNFWSATGGDALRVGYDTGGIKRGLLRFNLSSIPAGSTITSANLRLYYGYWFDYSGYYRTVTAYRVTEPWLEELVTWNNRPGSAESYGHVNLIAGTQGDFHYYDWDVTGLVQAWVNGSYPNHGILLRGNESFGLRGFFSWESGDAYTPQLVVSFTPNPLQVYRTYLPVLLKTGGGGTPPPVPGPIAAVVVSIADYEHMQAPSTARAGAPGYDLVFTTFDGDDVAYTLETMGGCCCGGCGSGLTASTSGNHVLQLTDSQATKAGIQDAIITWLDAREDENTLVVFFFSGHGMYDLDDNGDENDPYDEFIVPYDVDCNPCYPQVQNPVWLSQTAIRDDELDSWLDQLESKRIIVAVDSCFSGGLVEASAGTIKTLSLGAEMPGPLQVGDGFALDVSEGDRVVLMASREDQESAELGTLKNGAFSHYLVKALWSASADANGDGLVSAEEAFNYLKDLVDSTVFSETGKHQNPQIYDGVPGEVNVTCP